MIFKRQSILPGFWPAFSYTALYLSLIVLIPLSAVFLKSSTSGWAHFWQSIRSPNVMAAYRLSFGASLAAGLISVVVGFLIVGQGDRKCREPERERREQLSGRDPAAGDGGQKKARACPARARR